MSDPNLIEERRTCRNCGAPILWAGMDTLDEDDWVHEFSGLYSCDLGLEGLDGDFTTAVPLTHGIMWVANEREESD